MSDTLAVVVGIDHYPDAMLGPLKGAINDAEDFCSWLKTPAGGALTEDADPQKTEIHKVISTASTHGALSARPMVSDVEMMLDFVKDKAERRLKDWEDNGSLDPYRRLYLFFAGHGIGPDVEQAALLMANAGNGRFGYYVQGRPFANYFRARACFDEILLFMDCCRDAYPFVPAQPLKWDLPTSSGRAVNHCYGFATKWSKKSREALLAGRTQGFFSAALLEALRGSAADANGVVTADALERYTTARIPVLVKQAATQAGAKREVQTPEFVYPNQTPMVIADYGPAAASGLLTQVKIALASSEQGVTLEIQRGREFERVTPIGEARPALDTWTFRLPFGVYQIKNPATGRKDRFDVIGPDDVSLQF